MKYLVFDTETTGVDVFNDRVVQLYIMLMSEDGSLEREWEWVINPEVEVPGGAAEVHGLTTEYLQENGLDSQKALEEAREVFAAYQGATWVAYNLNFDLSILDREFRRHGIDKVFGQMAAEKVSLIDPLVIDRAKDKYRKGKRTLEAVAPVYGVAFDPEQAHDANYDVWVTGRVALKVLQRYGSPSTEQQAQWYKSWASGLEKYLRRADPDARVDPQWPLKEEA